jgi:hypothetical protein
MFIMSVTKLEGFYLDPNFKGSFEYTAEGSFEELSNGDIVLGKPGFSILNSKGEAIMTIPIQKLEDHYIFFFNEGIRTDLDNGISIKEIKESSGKGKFNSMSFDYKTNTPSFFIGSKPLNEFNGFQAISQDSHVDFYSSGEGNFLFNPEKKGNSFSYSFKSPNNKLSGKSDSSPLFFNYEDVFVLRNNPGVSIGERVTINQRSLPKLDLRNPSNGLIYF